MTEKRKPLTREERLQTEAALQRHYDAIKADPALSLDLELDMADDFTALGRIALAVETLEKAHAAAVRLGLFDHARAALERMTALGEAELGRMQ